MKVAPVLRYPGAKWRLADWIISYFPHGYEKMTYLEPFFGSGAVLFKKRLSQSEIVGDINKDVTNLFKVIRSHKKELVALVEMTPWSRDEFYLSYEKTGDELEDARRFLVRCWQGYGSKLAHRCGWRREVALIKGGYYPREWASLPDRILLAAARLRAVQIEALPAIELIRQCQGEHVLIYCDPPYLLSTRAGAQYADEMTDEKHIELLETLKAHPGPVLVSGYNSPLYDEILHDWTSVATMGLTHGHQKKVEVLWLNKNATDTHAIQSLFDTRAGDVVG